MANCTSNGEKTMEFKPFTLICGHYGCGKTNLSLNIALDLAARGEKVTLVDMDVVNPYFRSSDYRELVKNAGVRLIASAFAGGNLDSPAIPAEVASIFDNPEGYIIIDVGGDDVGATALGRFSKKISAIDYDMLYVVNKNRPITADAEAAEEILSEIERKSRIKATGIVNNTHLMGFTTEETVLSSMEYARQTAADMGLPLKFTTAPESFADKLDIENVYPVKVHVKTPWM